MKAILSIALLLCSSWIFAIPSYYEWQKERSRYVLTEKELAFPEFTLKYHKQYDYEWEETKLTMYETDHRITRVSNPETMQRHNRIYIAMRGVVEIVELKARAINKKGVVTNFDRNNLKEIKDEDTGNAYRIFAIEGVETDSEVEYVYTLKKEAKLYEGVYLQGDSPARENSLLISSPRKLTFDFRVYNDATPVKTDTTGGRNRYTIVVETVPALMKENFSAYDASRKRIEFKVAYNYTRSTARLNTWAEAGKTFYKALTNMNEAAEKPLMKFVEGLKIDPGAPMATRIKDVEDKIKKTIEILKTTRDPAHNEIETILKLKQGSGEGMTKLFVAVYDKLSIPTEIVITSDREKAKFDGTFDTWSFLDEYLIFFPTTNGFLCPGVADLRYPLVPSKFTANDGLFLERVVLGTKKSAITSVRPIPALPFTTNMDNLDIDVSFNDDTETNLVALKRSWSGYEAAYILNYYDVMTEDEKSKFIVELLKSSVPDIQISKWAVTMPVVNDVRFFNIDVTFTTAHFIERAGPKFLFKAGELIGPQSELYSENERQTDIENTYNRGYDRIIKIHLPKGMKADNLEALKIDKSFTTSGEVPFLFNSNYKSDGEVVVITIKEYYNQIYTPRKNYEDFRRVINAAADFNKVTLIIGKK